MEVSFKKTNSRDYRSNHVFTFYKAYIDDIPEERLREVEKAFRETFGNGILQNEHCTGIFFYCKDDTDVKGFKRKVRSIFKELNNK